MHTQKLLPSMNKSAHWLKYAAMAARNADALIGGRNVNER